MNPQRHKDIDSLTTITKNHLENLFNVYNDDVYYYNLMRTVNIPEDLDPSVYFLLKVDRVISLTTLSYKIYGNIKLWWLICAANNINDAVRPIPTGTVLRIIHPSKVSSIIESLDTRS